MAFLESQDLLRRPGCHHAAAAFAAFGAHVDHPVGRFDHIQLMFNHNDSIAQIDQPLEHVQKPLDVVEMQAGGGFVQDVERAAGLALAQFARQFDALRLAAGERGGGLAEMDVARARRRAACAAWH